MKRTTFEQLVAHGAAQCAAGGPGTNAVNGVPWSFMFEGCAVTHENDTCYVIATPNLGSIHFHPGDVLLRKDSMFAVVPNGKSVAHLGDWQATRFYADGMSNWAPATPPDLNAPYPENGRRTTGRLRSCSYCGSMHPTDLVAALAAGARMHWADFKYGWPHKVYVDDIPNPHAGMLESRYGASHAVPQCPKTGEPCTHEDPEAYSPRTQSWHAPLCECMKAGTVTEGRADTGVAVVRAQSGFDQHTGAATFTWRGAGEPARPTTHGKFYSLHLNDASDEERAIIERAMGRSFCWHEGKVWFGPYTEGGLTWEKVQEGLKRQQEQDAARAGTA